MVAGCCQARQGLGSSEITGGYAFLSITWAGDKWPLRWPPTVVAQQASVAVDFLANAPKMLQQILGTQEEGSNMHSGNQKILYSAPVLAQQNHLQRMSP